MKPANPVFPIDPEDDRNIDPIVDDINTGADDEDDDALGKDVKIDHNDDGSVVIDFGEDEPRDVGEFLENLAEVLPAKELGKIAHNLLDFIDKDKEARKRRDEQYADGIRRTGLGNDAPGGADFDGASRVVHPILAEGCIDFAARAMKEIFPPSGPCKTQIIGEATEEAVDKAERKKTYMNWQLTTQISEYRAEVEQMLTQLPLGGSQYLKIWYDDRVERPRVEFIPIDEMFLPFSVSDFYSSHRVTHAQMISRSVFESRIRSGLYRDIDFPDAAFNIENETDAKRATDKIEGVEDLSYNEDGLRCIYEIYVDYSLDDPLVGEDNSAPYIITIDEYTKTVLGIYRNWDEESVTDKDDYHQKLDWIVEFKFIPWRGAYGIGLPHIIGSMSAALTGALRALMDSAHINNMPGMFKMKGNRTSGQSINISPTEITEVDMPAGVDDIRKVAMPMPFSQPSSVLFQLLDWLTNQAKGVVGTAEEKIADASNNMPVGTALALIEQGSVVFSAIHARLHASQKKLLSILHRINSDNLSDEETIEELGSLIVRKADFQGPMDIIPVSDPNIFSEAQRFAQLQSVLQLAEKYPQLYKADKLNMRALQLLNFPDYKDVLIEQKDGERLDAVDENVTASEGKQPLKAYDDQDHLSHMMSHLHYALSPIFCANPMMAMPAIPALIAHVTKEHLPMFYKQNIEAAISAYSEVSPGASADDPRAQLEASAIADKVMAQKLAPIMQMLQQSAQLMKQFSPPQQQLDPASQVQLQIGQAAIASKEKVDTMRLQQDGEIKQAEIAQESQFNQQKIQQDNQANALASNAEQQSTASHQQNELLKSYQDSQSALELEKMRQHFEMAAIREKEHAETLRTILTLLQQSSGATQLLGDQYEQQAINESAQGISNGAEGNGDEEGRTN